ncbi:MAG TPA: TrkH family potassium uptake protein [Acidimicrobiia bacterium]|jgi:trk system potassium uptake protein TrkH|nr:TrkH family potassium uptake protein [Acidimicrobiia bacterium]
MAFRPLLHVIGVVVAAVALAMVAPVIVALLYQEWETAGRIAIAAALTGMIGLGARRQFPTPKALSAREGFAIVGLAWFAITIFGMLPYIVTGEIVGVFDALFESAAGFSTTGASIVPDPAELSKGLLFWRSLTQWLGGMGIIVLSIAVLPLLGVGGVQLARAESPGPTPDRLTPRFRETAKRLWLVYLGFTAAEVILLWIGDMNLFEAVSHSLTTMSTGGFGTDARSMNAFSAYSQWIVIIFMLLAGTSFALHYRALRKPKEYLGNSEFKLYLAIIVTASTVAILSTWGGAVGSTVRDALFTIISIVTTTGFATADFGSWPVALMIMIFGLFFVGGMAGSTGGSVKPYRLGVLFEASRADLRRVIHPRGVFVVRLGRDHVPDQIVESVQSFFLLYMFAFMTGTMLVALFEQMFGSVTDIVTVASAVASSIGNVGPGLGGVGPTQNYTVVHDSTKVVLSFLMVLGRLELFPVLLLFTRELWRR